MINQIPVVPSDLEIDTSSGSAQDQQRQQWPAREAGAAGRRADAEGSAAEARAAERSWGGG